MLRIAKTAKAYRKMCKQCLMHDTICKVFTFFLYLSPTKFKTNASKIACIVKQAPSYETKDKRDKKNELYSFDMECGDSTPLEHDWMLLPHLLLLFLIFNAKCEPNATFTSKIAKVYWLSQASARLPIFIIIIIYCYVAVNATGNASPSVFRSLSLGSLVNIVYRKCVYKQYTILLRKRWTTFQ